MSETYNISDEMIAKYLEGNATESEREMIRAYIETHPDEMAWLCVAAQEVAYQEQLQDGKSGVYHKSLMNKEQIDDDIRYSIAGHGKMSFAAQDDDDNSCAIKAQQLILGDYGIFVSTSELTRVAQQNGWYIEQKGSPFDFIGELLNFYNIPAVQMRNANVYHLMHELSQGHKIIVGVDNQDLKQSRRWQEFDDAMFGKEANHVLLVAGIQTNADGSAQIVLSDPSSPDNPKIINMQQFLSAWEDSGYFMVATTQPAPLEHNPSMQYFDYEQGHLQHFANVAYSEIVKRLAQDGYLNKNDRKKHRRCIFISTISAILIAGLSISCLILFAPFNMSINLNEDPKYQIAELPLQSGTLSITYGNSNSTTFEVTEKQNHFVVPDIPHKFKEQKAHLHFEAAGFVPIDTFVTIGKSIDIRYRHDNRLSKIFGFVIDSRNGQSLADVTIKVQNLTTTTDKAGNFLIEIPFSQQKSEQQVSAYKDGYTLWLGTYEPSETEPWQIVLEPK